MIEETNLLGLIGIIKKDCKLISPGASTRLQRPFLLIGETEEPVIISIKIETMKWAKERYERELYSAKRNIGFLEVHTKLE